MERLNSLRVTLVFIVTIIIPSLFLSAFAYQAIEGERVARRLEGRRRLAEEARTLARELDEGFRAPAREVRDGCAALRGKVRDPQDAASSLQKLASLATVESAHAPVAIYAADGRRVFPASRGAPRPTALPTAHVALGGGAAAVAPLEAVSELQAVRELARSQPGGREKALGRLARLEVGASRPTALAARLEIARLLVEGHTRGEIAVAASVLEPLQGEPIERLDPLGRPVVALARFEHARVADAMGQRAAYRERLAALLRDLGNRAALLAADDLAELTTRAGALLLAEGPEWEPDVRRATEAAEARRRLEARAERLDEVFGSDVREALRSQRRRRLEDRGERLPAAGVGPFDAASVVATGRAGPGDSDSNRWFLRRRVNERYEVLLLGPLERADGSLLGLATFPVDLDALAQRLVRDRVAARKPAGDAIFDVTLAPPTEDDLDRGHAPLAFPLEHVEVVARAREAASDVLTREGTTMKLWLIALSIAGVFAGAVVTTRTVVREAKAAELKSDFVTNVTHELRTPLTSIRMFIETLELGRVESEAEAKECLSIMARETDRLTRLIERLLAFSKIESRKWRFRFSYVPPLELAHEAVRVLKQQLQIKEGDPFPVEVDAIQDVKSVAVDRDAIVEVILNLLTNAWKYSPPSARRISVLVTERRKQVVIDVEDNGIGVPARDRRRIWKKFERGSNAEKNRIEGSGIGLTLALSIARGHGGTITLTPLRQGSRFSLILPKVGP